MTQAPAPTTPRIHQAPTHRNSGPSRPPQSPREGPYAGHARAWVADWCREWSHMRLTGRPKGASAHTHRTRTALAVAIGLSSDAVMTIGANGTLVTPSNRNVTRHVTVTVTCLEPGLAYVAPT